MTRSFPCFRWVRELPAFALLVAVSTLSAWGQAVIIGPSIQNPPYSNNYLYFNKMHWAGNWASNLPYNSQDVVNLGGESYVSLLPLNIGHSPDTSPSWWSNLPGSGAPGPPGPPSPVAEVPSPTYNFAPQTTGGTLVAGDNSVIFSNVPLGVNGSNTQHRLWVSGGAGTAEACLIDGGTGTSGQANGQIIINCLGTHSGAWTIGSATGGIEEALYSSNSSGITVKIPSGVTTIHAPIYIPSPLGSGFATQGLPRWSLVGQANMSSIIQMASDYSLAFSGMLTPGPGFAGSVRDLTLIVAGGQPDSTNIALYTHWPAAFDARNQPVYGNLTNVDTLNAWVSLDCSAGLACSGYSMTNMHLSGYSRGMWFGAGGADFVRISQVYIGPNINGTANNRIAHDNNETAVEIDGGFTNISNLQTTNLNVSVAVSGGNVNIGTLQCDSGSCLNISGGTTFVNNGFSSMAVAGNYFVDQTGGGLIVQDYYILKPEASSGPIVQISGTNVTTELRRLYFETGGFDTPFLTDSSTASTLLLQDIIYSDTISSPAGPFVTLTNSNITLIASGNVMPVRGVVNPAAKFISFAGAASSLTSGAWNISGNLLYGWQVDQPNAPSDHIQAAIITDNVGFDDQEPTITAVAGVLNFPAGYSSFFLAGNTTITSVTGLYPGRKIQILPQFSVQFTGGSTIGITYNATTGVPIVGFVATNGLLWLK